MTVVVHLDRCLDLRTEQNVPSAAVSALDDQGELLLRLKVVQAQDVELLVSYDTQRLDGVGVSELERQHPHAHARAVRPWTGTG